jgi:excisionase family DNA binding protein
MSQSNQPPQHSLFGEVFADLVRGIIREELCMLKQNVNGNGKLLTAEELADVLQVHKATVYEWVKCEAIPYYQSGRFVRFNLHEVLESQKKKVGSS